MGYEWKLADALERSEDSTKLSTSFIERLNLTIRRGSAYLNRRTPCHARSCKRIVQHLELLRCHYNFMRPHGSLRFGHEVRTPAMQAGLARRRLRLGDIFGAAACAPLLVLARMPLPAYHGDGEIRSCAAGSSGFRPGHRPESGVERAANPIPVAWAQARGTMLSGGASGPASTTARRLRS